MVVQWGGFERVCVKGAPLKLVDSLYFPFKPQKKPWIPFTFPLNPQKPLDALYFPFNPTPEEGREPKKDRHTAHGPPAICFSMEARLGAGEPGGPLRSDCRFQLNEQSRSAVSAKQKVETVWEDHLMNLLPEFGRPVEWRTKGSKSFSAKPLR